MPCLGLSWLHLELARSSLLMNSVDRLAMLASPRVVAEIDVTDLLCCHDLYQSSYKHLFSTNLFVIMVIYLFEIYLRYKKVQVVLMVKGLSCIICRKGERGLNGVLVKGVFWGLWGILGPR